MKNLELLSALQKISMERNYSKYTAVLEIYLRK